MPLKDFRSVHLPYCLLQQPDGRHVVLNREYKPIGFKTKEFLNYEDFPVLVKFKGLTKKVAAKLSWEGSEDVARIFLYDDGSIPTDSVANMSAYLSKLSLLAKLDIVEDEQ